MGGAVMGGHVAVLGLDQHLAIPIDQNGAEGMIAMGDGAAGDVERPAQKMLVKFRPAQTRNVVHYGIRSHLPLRPVSIGCCLSDVMDAPRIRMNEMKTKIVRPENASLGDEIVGRINELGAISETPGNLTRIFLSKEHRAAADLILGWMRAAGMRAHLDAIGNVCGRYEGERPGLPCLMLGSHYDTVRDAGKWDGPLGLITAISCVADLHRRGRRLPFAIEVTGFADEEGVRFASTLLGSRAVAGTFDESVLGVKDSAGISMREALVQFGLDPEHIGAAARARSELLAYVELHIEQGPVLEAEHLPVGVVTAISGATRLAVVLGWHGRPCRHRADGAAARRAGGRCGMHRRDRGVLPDRRRTGRHRRLYQRDAGRHQCDPGTGFVHHRHARGLGRASQNGGGRYRPADRKNRRSAANSRFKSTSPMKTAPCPARHG